MNHPCLPHRGRRTLPALVTALLLLAAPLHAATDTRAAKYYEDALTRYEKKDIAGAIIQLKNALQIDKTLLPVQVLLGKALMANGEALAAEVALNEALRLGVNRAEIVAPLAESLVAQGKQKQVVADNLFSPAGLQPATQLKVLLIRAAAHADLGDSRAALRAIDDARALDPRAVEVALAEVPVRVRAGQLREATTASDRALAMAPDSAEAWYQKGSVLHVGGALKEALDAYDKAVGLNAGHVEARVSRLGLRIDFRQYAEAAKEIAELQKVAPNEPRGAYLKALLAERENKPAEVKAALQEVTKFLDPVPLDYVRYRPQMLMLNGLAHLGLNENSKAKPYLEAFQRAQGSTPVAKLLAQIYIADREGAKAIPLLESYLKARPSDAQALNLLAAAHMAEGRHYKATALLQEALRAHDTPEMRTTLGLSLIGGGHGVDALPHLEAAFRKDAGQVQAGTALIGLYLAQRQPKKAVAIAEAMLKKQPNAAEINNLLGLAHAAAANIAPARAAFEKAIKLDPRLLSAKLGLARLDTSTKAYAAAEQRLTALLKDNERNPEVLYELAMLGQQRGDPDATQRWLEKAADFEGPRQVRAALALADLHLRLRRPAPALDAAKRASAKLPENLDVLLALATAQLANNDAGSARSALTTATKVAEYNAASLIRVAALQANAGDLAGASYSLEKAISGSPDFLPALAMAAEVDLRRGEHAAAEKRARAVVEKFPKRAIGHRLLGDVAFARGQRPAALDAYRRAHQIEPSSATLLRQFDALSDQDGGRPAIQVAEQWLRANPSDTAVRRAVAAAHGRSGNYQAARLAYEGLLKLAPDDAEALNNLANALLLLKDPGALKVAEKALAKDPGNPEIIDTNGWILLQSGQTDRALQLLREARLRNPANPEIRYHLAEALTKANRRAEAREELQAALAGNRRFESRSAAESLLKSLN